MSWYTLFSLKFRPCVVFRVGALGCRVLIVSYTDIFCVVVWNLVHSCSIRIV
ncbi:hypothetical protein EVA_03891 [gut metagenome]|uniref:Uncharacterized protein n=1 Tax=gut metagenome TaxID=749906 RepID=J9GXZ0_9ZZZZ